MLTKLFSAFLLVVGLPSFAQEISLKVVPQRLSVLPGEPMEMSLVMINTSGKELTLIGNSQKDMFVPDCHLWKGGHRYSESSKSVLVAGKRSTASKLPKYIFASGDSLTLQTGIFGHTQLPLNDLQPGSYTAKIAVAFEIYMGGEEMAKRIAESELVVEILEAKGADAAYLQALQEAAKQADSKQIKGPSFQAKPLKWSEVLYSFRVPTQDILDRFPTSTYVGHVLARKVYDYSLSLYKPVPPQEQVRASLGEGKTVDAFPEKDFECYFKKLDRFMKGGNVPEGPRVELWGFYGDLLVQRGRFAEAEEAFKKAVATPPQGPKAEAYFKRAQEFLAALEKKS